MMCIPTPFQSKCTGLACLLLARLSHPVLKGWQYRACNGENSGPAGERGVAFVAPRQIGAGGVRGVVRTAGVARQRLIQLQKESWPHDVRQIAPSASSAAGGQLDAPPAHHANERQQAKGVEGCGGWSSGGVVSPVGLMHTGRDAGAESGMHTGATGRR